MLSQAVYQVGIILLSVFGLLVAGYLHYQKKTTVEGMACPMDGSCEQVITSKYSKFLGFDVEMLGLAYYATILVAYSIFLLTPQAAPTWFVFGVLMSSVAAVLFSSYLTYIQGVTLRMWCTWCLVSASISVGILVLAVPAATIGLTALMAEYAGLMFWISVIAAASGLGTAVSYNTLLFNSLKNFEISRTQASTLNTVNQLTWVAVAALVVTGIGLYTGEASVAQESAFMASAFVVGFLIFNDSVYSLYVSEKIMDVDYRETEDSEIPLNLDKYVIVLAATSLYSWIALLTFKLFELDFTVDELIGFYLLGLMLTTLFGAGLNQVIKMRAGDELPEWSPLH